MGTKIKFVWQLYFSTLEQKHQYILEDFLQNISDYCKIKIDMIQYFL